MKEQSLHSIIEEQTYRALWEVGNVIEAVPKALWNKRYCEMPLWKHVYHMLHSLDLWFINPRDPQFQEPSFHAPGLQDLDVEGEGALTKEELVAYYETIRLKIQEYCRELRDAALFEKPPCCEYSKFTLILAQYRHLHSHMGMIMGFIIAETGLWPRVVGLEAPIPEGTYSLYF